MIILNFWGYYLKNKSLIFVTSLKVIIQYTSNLKGYFRKGRDYTLLYLVLPDNVINV